ncbi:hypothetical protein [uncultured Dubosiella sp.]|uniref:hypothetical protein n=1 Tax=uncultured Dubosiella sp. TaxID=1937011 RepID=UPI0025B2E946|nr:hypothetical protein [uncultured Dubosiella sp.]
MKEKWMGVVDLYGRYSQRILSIAGSAYLAVALLSYCLLFKQSQSVWNDVAVIGLDLIRKAAFIIFLISILYNVWKKKLDWKLCGGFFLLSGLVTFFSKDAEPIKMFFLLTALSVLPFDFILKKYYNVQSFILLLVITLTAFGVIENILYDKDRMRFGLGFDWTTTAAVLLLHILILYECVRRYKWLRSEVYLYLLGIMVIYLFTNSRFIFIMSVLFLGFVILQQKFRFFSCEKKWLRIALTYLPVGFFILSSIIFLLYDPSNGVWKFFNSALSDRLALGHSGLLKYGITIFGQPIRWVGYSFKMASGTYNYIDNSYVRFFLESGIVNILFYILISSIGIWDLYKKRQPRKIASFSFLMILGVIEPFFFNPLFNPFLIYGYKALNKMILKKTAQRRLEKTL